MTSREGIHPPYEVPVDAIFQPEGEGADISRSGTLTSGAASARTVASPSQTQPADSRLSLSPPLKSPKITATPREVFHGERFSGESLDQPLTPGCAKERVGPSSSRGSDLASVGDGFTRFTYGSVQDCDELDRHSLGPQLTDALECSFRSGTFVPSSGQSYTSLGRAAFHIFKGNVGTGVFLLPAYYRDAGYALGGVVVVLMGWLIIDCVLALIRAKQIIGHTGARTYPAVVKYVLGKLWMHFAKFSLLFTQFGFCVVYIQYASSLFAEFFTGHDLYKLFVFISIVVVTFMTFVSHRLGFLAYMSMIAAVFVMVVLAGATAEEVCSLSTTGVAPEVWAIVPTMRIFLFISGHVFSLEGIGVVLPVENSISPEDYPKFEKVVKYVNASIVALYVFFGVLGYLAYGEALESSVVLAMPASTMKVLMQVLLGLSLIFGYPIQFVPAIQLLDRALGIELHREKSMFVMVRVTFNIFVGAIAASIGAETVSLFAGFLGAFTGIHLMVTLPALLAIFTERVENARSSTDVDGVSAELSFCDYMKIFCTFPDNPFDCRWYAYIIFSLFVWVAGIYFTFAPMLSK